MIPKPYCILSIAVVNVTHTCNLGKVTVLRRVTDWMLNCVLYVKSFWKLILSYPLMLINSENKAKSSVINNHLLENLTPNSSNYKCMKAAVSISGIKPLLKFCPWFPWLNKLPLIVLHSLMSLLLSSGRDNKILNQSHFSSFYIKISKAVLVLH